MEFLKSPAKINLFLDILSKDTNGFHNINSILTLIDLSDEIAIKESNFLEINFSGEFSKEIDRNNIESLFDFLMRKNLIQSDKYSISIEKKIPVGAGLGGGSSNIATILNFLCSKMLIEYDKALYAARELGSDIEFFFDKNPAIVVGKGNILRRIKSFGEFYLILAYPNIGLSTLKVYEKNSQLGSTSHFSLDDEVYDFHNIMKSSSNTLQDAAINLCPDIRLIIDELSSLNKSSYSRMTGSGSCCFTVFSDKDMAQEAINTLKRKHSDWWVCLSKII